jgi:hypothetical protein
MTYGTVTNTATYTVVDIRKTFENFDADVRMIAKRTDTWTSEYVGRVVHDIVKLAEKHYLEYVDIRQLSAAGEVLQVSRFRVNSVGSAMTGARPGGNDWGPVYGSSLSVQLSYTAAWHALSAAQQAEYQTNNGFKIGWVAASLSSYTHLTRGTDRAYAAKGYELNREDYK